MNLQTIVALSLIFNLSFNALLTIGVGPAGTGFTYNNVPVPPSITATLQVPNTANQCSWGLFSAVCSFGITGLTALWSTILTFGYFIWGVLNILPLLAESIFIPARFLNIFFGDTIIVTAIQTAISFLYIMWAYVLITGRYNAEVT